MSTAAQPGVESEVQSAFLIVKWATSEIQEEAKRLHAALNSSSHADEAATAAAQELPRIKKALLYLNHAVQAALAAHAAAPGEDLTLAAALRNAVGRALTVAGRQQPPDASAVVRQVSLSLQQQVEAEVQEALSSSAAESAADRELLAEAIRLLRACESSVDTHARMALEVEEQVENSAYSDANFAYGSTPLSSWLAVVQHPQVAAALAECMPGRHSMVWGSSLGWLVFYSSLAFPSWRPCVGYELLACLHDCAEGIREKLRLSKQDVQLFRADMLTSNLEGVGLLFLANQCWDHDLMKQVSRKVEAELPEGSLVVEYRDALLPKGGAAKQQGEPTLRRLATILVPVSWNAQQAMNVYIKRPAAQRQGAVE